MSAFDQYKEFVSALFAPTDTICFAAIQEGQPAKHSFMSAQYAMTESCFESLVEANEKHSIYIAMNSFRSELIGEKKGRTKENVAEIKRLYIDADSNGQTVLDEVRSGSIVPLPNFGLETSPGKFQFGWNVSGLSQEIAEPMLKALAQEFGTDPAVAEIARVLRVPGLRNRKYPDAPEVKVVGEISSRVYQVSDFRVAYKPTETIPEKEVAPRDENNKIPHRFLYHFLIKEAGRLRSAGYTVEQIQQILPMWAEENCAPPLDFKKIDSYALAATPWEQGSPTGGELFLNQQASQAQTVAPGGQTELETMRASSVKPKAIEWLWYPRIPMNKISVLAGEPDQGKSLISLYIAAKVSRAEPMYGDSSIRVGGEVLIFAAEDDSEDTIRPRLEAAGANLDNVHLLKSRLTRNADGTTTKREVRLDTDLKDIESYLLSHPNIRVVIIDPVSSYLGQANMNKEQEVRAVLTPFKTLAEDRRVAIIFVAHTNKTTDQSAIHRVGGAVAFTGVARAVWMFIQDKANKENHQMVRVKNNIAKAIGGLVFNILSKDISIDGKNVSQPLVHFIGETENSASDLLLSSINSQNNGRPRVEIQRSTEWLETFLSNGPEAVADIETAGKKAKHTKGTLDRAKKELGVEAYQVGRKWWWKLSNEKMAAKKAALAANTKSFAATENSPSQ